MKFLVNENHIAQNRMLNTSPESTQAYFIVDYQSEFQTVGTRMTLQASKGGKISSYIKD